ncbi:hypothetical protein EDEG_00873 [Edhazardia aedis USNM 41457]|uniref:Uncharacterized protein n=1 Tax=Edhazardia aedis (strain USNM 41457) TaxID=1003232 RepID=J9DR14_EDHAE|nr:hypothetical protein EDEG_00873 [Edhazardia aedis USNM 41457]|eukprot:EJW05020.1 hypothetical protein EDEG_00873 [Edhazardia aedis USNM 41457]
MKNIKEYKIKSLIYFFNVKTSSIFLFKIYIILRVNDRNFKKIKEFINQKIIQKRFVYKIINIIQLTSNIWFIRYLKRLKLKCNLKNRICLKSVSNWFAVM